jgi:hypothetical protein
MKQQGKKQLTVNLPEWMLYELKIEAAKRNTSMTELVAAALRASIGIPGTKAPTEYDDRTCAFPHRAPTIAVEV